MVTAPHLSREILPCPVCRSELAPTERVGVEIDICPTCRGVWLDRGELEKILQRAGTPDLSRDGNWTGPPLSHARRPKRHKSWLEELFD